MLFKALISIGATGIIIFIPPDYDTIEIGYFLGVVITLFIWNMY